MGIGFAGIGILVAFLIRETRSRSSNSSITPAEEPASYAMILRDKIFLQVLVAYSLNRICTSTLWMMLAAYTKQNYGLSERHYGFIPTTNAIMVITMQLFITRQVIRYKPSAAMAFGALVYAVSIFCVAFGTGFWWFWLCMVGATIGEMILVPTTTTYTSRLAPPAMRARYMSLYNLTWSIGSGLGPLLAWFLLPEQVRHEEFVCAAVNTAQELTPAILADLHWHVGQHHRHLDDLAVPDDLRLQETGSAIDSGGFIDAHQCSDRVGLFLYCWTNN
jgi:MFS family permease